MAYVHKIGISSRVFFLGKRNNVNQLLNVFDCFILPSITEGLGIVLLEAQANGLPCFVNSSLPKEVNVTGEITFISLDNILELSRKIKLKPKRFYNNDYYEKIIKSNYNIKNSIHELENIFDSIVMENSDEE